MSVQKRGSSYVVRWREGGRQLSRSFTRRGDAVAFETDVRRRHQLGALAPVVVQSRMTLAEFVREEWWPRYAVPNLKPSTQRKALMMLQGILRRAVVRGLIPANPVAVVNKPRQPPTRRPDPLPPTTVEQIRAQLAQRDAALVSLLAYAGLRPDEATKARWGDLRERTIHVHASKTERPGRSSCSNRSRRT